MTRIMLSSFLPAAANGDRYIRNNALMGVARGFQASQAQIRDMQDRLDARIKARHDAAKEEEAEEGKD